MEILAYSHLASHQNDALEAGLNPSTTGRLRTATVLVGAMIFGSAAFQANPVSAQVVLSRNNTGEDVVRLQDRLAELGYFDVESTGFYGTITEDAVLRFQQDRGLAVDGIAGAETFAALYGTENTAAAPVEGTNASNAEVNTAQSAPLATAEALPATAQLQRDLNALGYDAGTVDGLFGEQTSNAILAFQTDYGLTANGIPTISTLQALEQALGNYSYSASNTQSDGFNSSGTVSVANTGTVVGTTGSDANTFVGVGGTYPTANATRLRLQPNQDGILLERGDQTGLIVVNNDPSYTSTLPLQTAAVSASPAEIEGFADYPALNENTQQIAYVASTEYSDTGFAAAPEAIAYTQPLYTNPSSNSIETATFDSSYSGYTLPYVVAVPERKYTTIQDVQAVAPGAYLADSPLGNFIYVGSFANREEAEGLSRRLRQEGLDARVNYQP